MGRIAAQGDSEPEIAQMSYEEARSQLVEIVARLEQGSIPLEESLRLWERGERLALHCQAWLDGARERLAAAQAESLASDESPDPDESDLPGREGLSEPARRDETSNGALSGDEA